LEWLPYYFQESIRGRTHEALQEDKTGPVWALVPVGRGRMYGNGEGGEYDRNIMYSCMKMEKRDKLKLFQEWGERGKRENNGGSEFN
jgi:hypothetical protein